MSKDGLKSKVKPGKAVVVSGTSARPSYSDTPVDLSADDKDLVLEYSGNSGLFLSFAIGGKRKLCYLLTCWSWPPSC